MPGLSHRREEYLRAGRFESEARISDFKAMRTGPSGLSRRVFTCSSCGKMFLERSRHCPRCDSTTMGEVKSIPEEYREKLRDKEIRRLRRKHGA